MLDVVHFLMEDDTVGISREQQETRDRFRTMMYPDFYGNRYVLSAEAREAAAAAAPAPEPPELLSRAVPDIVAAPAAMIDPPVDAPVPIRSYGNMAPTRSHALTGTGNHMRAETPTLVHKPYIPPTDMNMTDNAWSPFPNLREAPQL